ncbi:carbohydrate ABC transporter permease [Kibdelosporangium phytohabitans]|uniref:Sugar ABC transporter permease n=1 Tax=Kibdelosporangium phytohabitans TaxID=860235 RepID=A0A0N9HU91_9PSEU|nr:sugar ABC transporter permease [Kibdelosporangium phytohabitans]ALG10828.1 sugar ABC transporter permease [Kibdelosporangium phytohabitans]MBE1462000.1 multiple sugar transport system permease protein [Kibdelosporangium phytohabitans]
MTTLARRGDAAGEAGRLAALLLSPTFVVLGLVVGYPLVAALRESLYQSGQSVDADGFVVQGDQFAGLDNYTGMFSGPAATRFWNAFGNTTFFTVTTVAAEVVIGVAMALVMHQALRWRGLVRASILVPWAIPTAVSAILWQWIFQADGVANALIGNQILWTTEGWQAKFAVMIADVWKTAPFIGLLVLAGLQVIPRDVYEAARVDGASPARQFWSITLPLVRPVLVVAVLFRVLDSLRMFDLPFVLIGNRKESVETLTMLAWDEASNLRFGPAAAYATILFVYIAVVAFVFVKLLGADVIGEVRDRGRQARERGPEPLAKPEVVPA